MKEWSGLKNTKIKKADIILMMIIILTGCVLLIGMKLYSKGKEKQVVISVDGVIEKTFPLDENVIYNISSEKGENTLVIENGKAYVKEADCRDGICKKKGKIGEIGENIVCLPHKMIISIEENSSERGLK